MKVKQLIEELQKFDNSLEVVTNDAEWGYFLASSPKIIKDISINTDPFSTEKARTLNKAIIL